MPKKATTKKIITKKKVVAKSKTVSKAASAKTTAKSATTKKRVVKKATVKAAATKKRVTKASAAKKSTVKKTTTVKASAARKPTARRAAPRAKKSQNLDFDFNKWLLPTLELEQYEPEIQEELGVKDNIHGSTRYAWIGSGQCGGRIVKSFYDLGYNKAIAVNTTHHDLDLLDIPADQKLLMDIGANGAGKDIKRGRQATREYNQDITDKMRAVFGTNIDQIMVAIGAGGGTGSGSAVELVDIAKKYARSIGLSSPGKRVGVVMTLPDVGEAHSPIVAHNAYTVARELSDLAAANEISPLIIIDNEKVSKLYPGMTVKSFWPSINQTVAGLFDIFNSLSAMSSQYTSFDPADYHSIMRAGNCSIMGLTKVTQFRDRFELSKAVKKNLQKTLLAGGFDLTTARLAGCIVVGGKKMMANTPGLADNINFAFDALAEITGNASIHRGIYEDGRETLRVYTIIGGLDAPLMRFEELTDRMSALSR